MGYAAYREHPGQCRTGLATSFGVLDVTVACTDALGVRRAVAGCEGAGVVRCEPLLHQRNLGESAAPRVRLMVRLPLASYAQVLHRLMAAVPCGEIGRLVRWGEHLDRCGLRHEP